MFLILHAANVLTADAVMHIIINQNVLSLRYRIKKISIQCTSESVFLYEIKK